MKSNFLLYLVIDFNDMNFKSKYPYFLERNRKHNNYVKILLTISQCVVYNYF